MRLRRSSLGVVLRLGVAGCVLVWLSAASGWSSEHAVDQRQDLNGCFPGSECTTADSHQCLDPDEISCATLDAIDEGDELAIEAESGSQGFKLHFVFFKADASALMARENTYRQLPRDYDRVFMPDVCAGPANRCHAPPAFV
jgi:hypothetical protein